MSMAKMLNIKYAVNLLNLWVLLGLKLTVSNKKSDSCIVYKVGGLHILLFHPCKDLRHHLCFTVIMTFSFFTP